MCSWLLSYLQAAPELSLKRGGGVKNSLFLIGHFGFWAVFLRAAFLPERGLLSFASQGHLNIRDAKDEGLIADQRSTIHENLLNDGLHFFWGYTPVQNPVVHEMDIFTSFLFISDIFKFLDSYTEKSGSQGRVLIQGRKSQKQ